MEVVKEMMEENGLCSATPLLNLFLKGITHNFFCIFWQKRSMNIFCLLAGLPFITKYFLICASVCVFFGVILSVVCVCACVRFIVQITCVQRIMWTLLLLHTVQRSYSCKIIRRKMHHFFFFSIFVFLSGVKN